MIVPHDSHQTGWWTISVLVQQKTIIILVVRETKILLAENAVLSSSQLTLTYSKSRIETLEKSVKYVQS